MKRIQLLVIMLLACAYGTMAQNNTSTLSEEMIESIDPTMLTGLQDSSNVEVISLPPKLYMWRITENLGEIVPVPVDTVTLLFQNTNLNDGLRGNYNQLGNLGSPRLSRMFMDRRPTSQALFLEPYNMFITQPHEHNFTNSNIPYVNISYYTNFDKQDGEDRVKAYYSVNATKNLAFGFNFDYLYGRGYYNHQATSFLKGGFFGSYTGDKYSGHLIYNLFNQKMQENGGITDDMYITAPEEMSGGQREYRSTEIPVALTNTFNYNRSFYIHYTHRYNLGFYKDVPNPESEKDSIETFVPVTSFIHMINVERSRHKFISSDADLPYTDKYLDIDDSDNYAALDTTTYIGIRNTFGIALREGFNKYAKAGLTAYISHKYNSFSLMDSIEGNGEIKLKENEVYLGAEIAKRKGILHYNALGEVGISGEASGQYRISGGVDIGVPLWGDSLTFAAKASLTNKLPQFYYRHYHSKYAWWDNNDMSKERRTQLEAKLNYHRTGTGIRAGMESIENYTYFGPSATPLQAGDKITVLSAVFSQNFQLGILHWDNEITWQKSDNEEILPLPKFSVYSNLYLNAKLAKVLTVQLGVDYRYFTRYKAPAYSPIIQQFHLQGDDAIEIGNFPVANVYANFHLKRTRFFVMLSHVNESIGTPNYFTVPHYPINPMLFRFGVSWNFYD